ncbi:hypothetical protein H5410_047809 [Solanum commersonii]|uniref:PB1-like domain-containing protein n=1 Tax=Solanum commersonii TaxID=4109 RepID=A0A9J5XIF7_SOLCO|nr:hypothetical protein H5410_047809 [Solanum commersonii]
MSGFTLVTLRWYHGGVLDLSSGQLVYSGGQVTEFLDVDVDRLSYFKLRGYIKELGYTTTCTFSIKPPNKGLKLFFGRWRYCGGICKALD